MLKINQVKLPVKACSEGLSDKLKKKCAQMLKLQEEKLLSLEILRRSIDARKKPDLYFSYTVAVSVAVKDEAGLVKRLRNRDVSIYQKTVYGAPALPGVIEGEPAEAYFRKEENRPRVIGFGPAGMFAGLILARAGLRPIIVEQGESVEERVKTVEAMWEKGKLNPDSNPQFGEGGAGTFSDGKLNTLVKDRDGRSRFVLETFVRYGADADILMDAKPHVGTDRLIEIVRGIREEILSLGGEIHFRTKFTYTGEETYPIILAIGHSSRDSYEDLFQKGLHMEAKDFAMGLRVQHPQSMINDALYGRVDAETLALLGPGAYKVTHTCENGRGVYSFCMCPGGYVVNSSSEEERLCVNGMSYSARDSENANAAIIVSIRKSDYAGDGNPLGGIALQRELETRAFRLGGGNIPIERYGDFRRSVLEQELSAADVTATGKPEESAVQTEERIVRAERFTQDSERLAGSEEKKTVEIRPVFRGSVREADLTALFAFAEGSPYESLNEVNRSFVEGMEAFERQIPGFSRGDTILAGIEARTSSPVRIPRDETFRSNIRNIYPCGEGAGYAGGITSAAMDGMKVAEAVIRSYFS